MTTMTPLYWLLAAIALCWVMIPTSGPRYADKSRKGRV
jgi:hypothetical protein